MMNAESVKTLIRQVDSYVLSKTNFKKIKT